MFPVKRTKNSIILTLSVALILIAIFNFTRHDAFLYKNTVAQIVSVQIVKQTPTKDWHGNKDTETNQRIRAVILNGKNKGNPILLTNDSYASEAYSQTYSKGMDIFVHPDSKHLGLWRGTIVGIKRDTTILMTLSVFILLLVFIGKKQGNRSILSLLINIACISLALDFYLKHRGISLLLIFIVVVLVCTVVSLLLVSGYNRKTVMAIFSTLIATYLSLFIAYLTIHFTGGNGLHYDTMEYVTIPPQYIFLAELLIGSLGAIMDIAITITSAIDELYSHDPGVSKKRLRRAGSEIGGDVMGVMTNILLFAYISGSVPIIILCLKNGYPLGYAFSLNLSLEMVRFLVGAIGIVLAIPITIQVALFILFRKRVAA